MTDHQAADADHPQDGDTSKTAASDTNGVHVDAAMQRAEAAVDVAAQHMGRWAAVFGHGVQRIAARAREEGEDIWAEAQHIRHDHEGGERATPDA